MNKRRLIISFFLGMLALSVASLSFSIAWYASATYLTVDSIDIEIQADRKLQISTTNREEDFVDRLNYEDLKQNVGAFIPVSTVFSDEWIQKPLENPKPIFYDQSFPWTMKGEPEKHEAYNGFYSQEIYIDCDDDVFVTIDTESTFLRENKMYNEKYAKEIEDDYPELTREEIVQKLNEIPKSMRFSILVPLDSPTSDEYYYYVIDPNKKEGDDDVEFGGILDNSNQKDQHYYDCYLDSDDKLYETVYGDVNDRSLIKYKDEAETEDSVIVGERSAFNAHHQKGVHRFDYEASKANGMQFAKENSITYDDIEKDPYTISIPVYGYSKGPRKIIVSIYIEGWDLRSINSTMGASFLAELSFKILREM